MGMFALRWHKQWKLLLGRIFKVHIESSGEILDFMHYILGLAPKGGAYQSRVLARWDKEGVICDDVWGEEERRLPTSSLEAGETQKDSEEPIVYCGYILSRLLGGGKLDP